MIFLLIACTDPPVVPTPSEEPIDTGLTREPFAGEATVTVTLDGEPVEGAVVTVGGGAHGLTGADGRVRLPAEPGDSLIASHPEARTRSTGAGAEVTLALTRFSREDNEAYVFQDPGISGERGTTAQCAHCHGSMVTDWTGSPHRDAASNPVVHDVFAGTAAAVDEADCDSRGGTWRAGLEPGTGASVQRCYLGAGALPDLNPDCGVTESCDGIAADTAGCADCHAPGIDGVLGGRSLLEATGRAYTEGVHCDVCHKVEAVDLEQPPGVAGALQILRPSEPSTTIGLDWAPLTFAPYTDVPNPRMGAVPREHFREARFCAGCHEARQDALIPGQSLAASRWPEGLPVHTTYSEWSAGPYAPGSPCQSCHMPPETRYGNAADLEPDTVLPIDVASGWFRAPGSVRRHLWDGPRGDGPLLGLAAALDLETSVQGEELVARVTTTNVGAGHAIPTGEPLRALILVVEARCDGEILETTGGDLVSDVGGLLDRKEAGEDWTRWPGAEVGDRIRVTSWTDWRDYVGPLTFGDGTFGVEEKGMRGEQWIGEAVVTAVEGDLVTLDGVLPTGDVATRVDGVGLPETGEGRAWAGASGFAFARVLVDAEGVRQVPHHRAVDVVSDNRISPQQAVQTEHRFRTTCAEPTVQARLVHRPYPLREARLRGWPVQDQVMAEVTR